MTNEDYSLFTDLNYDKFRELAKSKDLSNHEKVGFPNSYREGKEHLIMEDICSKLPFGNTNAGKILEIGPGCSGLPLIVCNVHYSPDCAFMVVASDYFKENDSTPDYTQFRKDLENAGK